MEEAVLAPLLPSAGGFHHVSSTQEKQDGEGQGAV